METNILINNDIQDVPRNHYAQSIQIIRYPIEDSWLSHFLFNYITLILTWVLRGIEIQTAWNIVFNNLRIECFRQYTKILEKAFIKILKIFRRKFVCVLIVLAIKQSILFVTIFPYIDL